MKEKSKYFKTLYPNANEQERSKYIDKIYELHDLDNYSETKIDFLTEMINYDNNITMYKADEIIINNYGEN